MDQALLDQLHAARFPLAYAPDSTAEAFYRPLPSSEPLFSSSSSPVGGPWAEPTHPIEADRWGVSLVALGLVVFYCWILYRYRKAVSTSLKAVLSLEDTFLVFDHLPHEFRRFLSFSRLSLASAVALSVVLVPLSWVPVDGGQVLLAWGAVLLYVYASVGLQRAMLWVVSRFDAAPDRLWVLSRMGRLDWAVAAVFFPPLVVVLLGFGDWWVVWAVVLAAALALHWIRLFAYFKWTGFSILQWFLYLCTLEVLPFTLLWGVGRTVGSFY